MDRYVLAPFESGGHDGGRTSPQLQTLHQRLADGAMGGFSVDDLRCIVRETRAAARAAADYADAVGAACPDAASVSFANERHDNDDGGAEKLSRTRMSSSSGSQPSSSVAKPRKSRSATTLPRASLSPSRRYTLKGNRQQRNPFLEYEDKEVRSTRERKWLQDDSTYMLQRKEDLRHGTAMKNLDTRAASAQELYDKRIYYGPCSAKLRASKSTRRTGRPAAHTGGGVYGRVSVSPHRQGGGRGRGDANATSQIRRLQQELQDSGALQEFWRTRTRRPPHARERPQQQAQALP